MPVTSTAERLPSGMGQKGGSNSTSKSKGKAQNSYHGLGSTVKLIKHAGEAIAITHPVPKTGYKAPNAYGVRPIFEDATTTATFQKSVQKVGDENVKKLMPYHPNASRNRPPTTLANVVGCRNNPNRNASQILLRDGDPDSRKVSKTTNQVFMDYECETTGMSNQGISSEIAKMMHQRQRR
eukprot:TRINITY_DN18969_c0_g1_i1.p1 TRINITY_DN18969_c0_g1~~TRINITY_DN18969_c0_g1_i1.p1  ORF type:complete len:181 (+),score=27.82 TRINITY_DN18969_c0_g1_i1:162-704(+)